MDTVGILPAAGLCSRWNGTYKELLPTWENTWVIDSSIDSMKQAGVHNFVIVSSPQKNFQAMFSIFQKISIKI
jgi:hypothetical protein